MGQCLSQVRYSCELLVDEEAWSKWGRHRVHRFYKVGPLLGKGAFSQARTFSSLTVRVQGSMHCQ